MSIVSISFHSHLSYNTFFFLIWQFQTKCIFVVDAFVALGGLPTKEGYISKNTLIEIIKTEFELTIDMEVKTIYFIHISFNRII